MKQLILITMIWLFIAPTVNAEVSSFVCVKKSKELNLCLKYGNRSHHTHFKRQRMVSISNQQYIYFQPKNKLTEAISHIEAHKHNKHEDNVLDTVIKIAILKEILEK